MTAHMTEPDDFRRHLPSIDRLISSQFAAALLQAHPRAVVVDSLRQVLAEIRVSPGDPISDLVLLARAAEHLDGRQRATLRPVINATGVILHTNLGRAPLSEATRAAMEAVARGYSSLEFDLESGERGSRHDHLTDLLQRLTGAEAALVVNNNAGAILLALAALAQGQEVIISRGQLVEIGGGFRIPDVLAQSGAQLVEVGTTNRTYIEDYARAVSERTAALLRVHSSNFRVIGFVHSAGLSELATLAQSRSLHLIDDLGSGSLLPTERYGLAHEPQVQESIAAGADLVAFSGDKLLGGPQAGILVGKAAVIDRLRRHPLTRALRPDKGTIAGLFATLQHYARGEAIDQVPVWRMISTSMESLEGRALRILDESGMRDATVVACDATVGGGSLPGETLPSRALALRPLGASANSLAARLRHFRSPIMGRIAEDLVLLDLRTVAPEEDADIIAALATLNA